MKFIIVGMMILVILISGCTIPFGTMIKGEQIIYLGHGRDPSPDGFAPLMAPDPDYPQYNPGTMIQFQNRNWPGTIYPIIPEGNELEYIKLTIQLARINNPGDITIRLPKGGTITIPASSVPQYTDHMPIHNPEPITIDLPVDQFYTGDYSINKIVFEVLGTSKYYEYNLYQWTKARQGELVPLATGTLVPDNLRFYVSPVVPTKNQWVRHASGWGYLTYKLKDIEYEEYCGDGICQYPETNINCPEDCPADEEPEDCGDGICQATETCETCPEDCGVCPVILTCEDYGYFTEPIEIGNWEQVEVDGLTCWQETEPKDWLTICIELIQIPIKWILNLFLGGG